MHSHTRWIQLGLHFSLRGGLSTIGKVFHRLCEVNLGKYLGYSVLLIHGWRSLEGSQATFKRKTLLLSLFLYNNKQTMPSEQESALDAQLAIDFVSGLSVLQTFLITFASFHEFLLMAVIFRFIIWTCLISIKKNPKALQVNRLFLFTRYFFWFRRWRLRTGRLPGNSHLKSGEYKHGTLDQSSDPRLYNVNHFLLLNTKWRQRCCTQTSWCYGSNTYRLVYGHFEYVQFNMNFVSHIQLMLLYEVL